MGILWAVPSIPAPPDAGTRKYLLAAYLVSDPIDFIMLRLWIISILIRLDSMAALPILRIAGEEVCSLFTP